MENTMHSRNCVPYPTVAWITGLLLALVLGITAIFCVVVLASERRIADLQSQVTELQARPQGYSQIEVIDLPHANGTSFEQEMDLVPGAKALVILHSSYTGHLDFYIQDNVQAQVIGGFDCNDVFPSQDLITVNGQWTAHDFSTKPLGVVYGEKTCLIEVTNTDTEDVHVLFQTVALP